MNHALMGRFTPNVPVFFFYSKEKFIQLKDSKPVCEIEHKHRDSVSVWSYRW